MSSATGSTTPSVVRSSSDRLLDGVAHAGDELDRVGEQLVVQPRGVGDQWCGRLDQLRAAVHQVAGRLVDERELPLDPDGRPGRGMEVDRARGKRSTPTHPCGSDPRGACQHGAMLDARTLNLTLDFCLRVGELLLSSGAGAADVTATMRALSWHAGRAQPRDRRHVHVDVDELPVGPRGADRAPGPARHAARHRLRGPHPGGPPGARRGHRPRRTWPRPARPWPGSCRPATAVPRWAVTLGLGRDVRAASA